MLYTLQVCNLSTGIRIAVFGSLAVLGLSSTLLAAEVQCRFKAEAEATEVHIIKDGQTRWAGSIQKQETKTISLPEGAFTVVSKVYNPNLKSKEDIRADIHTRLCEKQALTVPLFPESEEQHR